LRETHFKKYSIELNSDWHGNRVDRDSKKVINLKRNAKIYFELFYNSSNFGELSNNVKTIVDKKIRGNLGEK
jgi:hypothetical protein